MKTRSSKIVLAVTFALASVQPTLHAAIYNWDGNTNPNLSGNYSDGANWSLTTPTLGADAPLGGPSLADTAVLTDVTSGTRVVAYDGAAAATIQQLDFNQTTAGAINQFNILKTGTITNAVTLAASAGTEEIRFSSASAFTFTLGNALTVNTGGLLNFNSANSIDGRFLVKGNFTVAGGEVKNASGFATTLVLEGGTNSISPISAFGSNINISMAGGNQTLASTVALNNILLRGSGTIVKTISGTSVGRIAFINSLNNGSTTLKLGSNLTSSSLPFAENFANGATVNFGIDTGAGFTLDLTGNPGTYTPNIAFQNGGAASVTNYNFTGTGTIKANTFNLSSATQVNVGANTVLEATNTVGSSILSGGGTIDPTSTYRWSGGISGTAVHTLTSTRTLGNLEVKTGILSLSSGAPISALSTVNVGNSASTDQNAIFRFNGGGTYGNFFDLSKAPQLITSSTGSQPRNRLELAGTSQTLNLTNNIVVGQTGSVANLPAVGTNTTNRRAEFNVIDATSTMNITGLISQNTGGTAGSFSGININGSNAGEGTVRLGNINNSFTASVTVTRGTLILGGNAPSGGVGVLGNSTSQVSLADGGTTATSTVSVLTDGGFTVGRIFNLGNAAGGVSTASYVLGSTAAANSTFSGNIISASSADNKALTLTQAASGTSTFSGLISENAGTGATNVIKAGLGTVILTNANNYDGTTTVSAGTLLVNNTAGSGTGAGAVAVNNSGTLGGTGNVAGPVTISGTGRLTGGTAGTSAADAAGNVGTLTTGALTLASTSTFLIDIGTASSFDKINLLGTGSLGGATLSLNVASGINFTSPITIIENDGSDLFTGTFLNLAEGETITSGGYIFSASYIGGTNANDFTLTAVPEPSTYLGGGLVLGLAIWSQRKRFAA